MERKTDTVEIGQGVKYAKVAARSAEFHRDNERCDIQTTCEFKDGWVIFSAQVITKKGIFTGHSMAKVAGRQKQFEKQETIAVGRALAFAGYLASGEIACAEEMADVVTDAQLNSLKLKYSQVHADDLRDLDRPAKQGKFSAWCYDLIGEQVDYQDSGSWTRDWYDACWNHLRLTDVPFEA